MIGGLAALCGAALVLAQAPFDWWPLAFVSCGGLFALLKFFPNNVHRIGWGFGLAKYLLGTSWVYVSINVYGQAPPPLAALLVVLMSLLLAVFVWLQCWAYVWLVQERAPVAQAVLFGVTWTLGEWMMTWMLSGFPWLFVGYSQLASPLAHYAPIGGVLLVSFVVASAAALVLQLRQAPVVATLLLVGLLVPAIVIKRDWTQPLSNYQVALVQGNIDQAIKWHPERRLEHFQTHLRLTQPHWDADLIIWPEAAITAFAQNAEPWLQELDTRGRDTGSALLSGVPIARRDSGDQDGAWQVFNGAVMVGSGSGTYLKKHLVPFGEYVPFEGLLRGLIQFFNLPMSSMSSGPDYQANFRFGEVTAALAICYEIAFPELVRQGAADADVLITISNDTWFGQSIGPLQHLQIAQMRALELGRWVLRGTNNGVTAVIDPNGDVIADLPQFEEGVLTSEFATMSGKTPFHRFGQTPLLIILGIGLLAGLGLRVRSGWQ